MEQLLQYIADRVHLTAELKAGIIASFEQVPMRKRDKILREGKRADYLYFVEKGILHNYYYHNDQPITSWFYTENYFVTAWHSFYSQRASFEEIECLEDGMLYRISYTNYQKLITAHPAFNTFARILAEQTITFIDEYGKGWSFLSAKEKYQQLQAHLPDIELRVKLGLIASFLGISQATLSRIRAAK
ncbi:MAG: Crp/Fnr family transcriptional regulator [Bacteroidota bacterium]